MCAPNSNFSDTDSPIPSFQASARGAALPDRGVPAAAQRRVHLRDEQAHDGGAGAEDLRARRQARTGKKEEFSAVATLGETALKTSFVRVNVRGPMSLF